MMLLAVLSPVFRCEWQLDDCKMIFTCSVFQATDALEMMLLADLSPVFRCEWQLDDY